MGIRHVANLFSDQIHTLPILILYLTDGCNSRCAMCDIWRSPRRNMSTSLIRQLSRDAQRLHTRWVVLSGGEAMQHPEWPATADAFRRSGARVILLTNGLFLRRDAGKVIASIDEVVVSLDAGCAETYLAIRGVDAFDLVLEGISAVRAGGIPVTTRTTLQQANFREMPAIVRQARAAGADHVSFLTLDVSNPVAFGPRFEDETHAVAASAYGRLSADDAREMHALIDDMAVAFAAEFASGAISEPPAKLHRMADTFLALAVGDPPPPVRCNAPHISLVVEVDGTIRPCYFLPSVADAKISDTQSLQSILNHPQAVSMRRAYRTGQRRECTTCVCPLYKGARALAML